jgi:hypothetical protein
MQRDRFLGVSILVAGTLVAASVAFATIPSPDGTIHGCYLKSGGRLRVIDKQAGQKCTSKEVALSWSQQGPQGPQGSPGPEGPRGPEGPAGANGSSIVARLRLATPVTINVENQAVNVPLDPGTWVQRPGEVNSLVARVEATSPPSPHPSCHPPPQLGNVVTYELFLDGVPLSSLGGAFPLDQSKILEVGIERVLFEPGVETDHTVTAQVRVNCAGTVIEELSIDVMGVR